MEYPEYPISRGAASHYQRGEPRGLSGPQPSGLRSRHPSSPTTAGLLFASHPTYFWHGRMQPRKSGQAIYFLHLDCCLSKWIVPHTSSNCRPSSPPPSSTPLCSGLRRPSNMASTSPPTAPETPATATTAPQSRGPGIKQEYSCVLCKQRKVRCDRLDPCSSCVRAGVSCLPGVRQPYKRRRKHVQGGNLKRVQASERSGLYSAPSRSLDSTSSPEESRSQRQVPTFGQYDPSSVGMHRSLPRPQTLPDY